MSDIAAALARLGATLDLRAAEFDPALSARAYVRELGVFMEVKVTGADSMRVWHQHCTWDFIRDDPQRAVDGMLAHFEEKVVRVLARESEL